MQSTAQIGIEKLTMLSSLPEEERQTVIETVNIESSSVTELKNKIEEITKKSDKEKEDFQNKEQSYKYSISELENELTKLKGELSNKSTKVDKSEELEKLKEKIKKLEEEKSSQENLAKMHKQSLTKMQDRCESLQKQLEINNSTELVEFKLKFDELQQNIYAINHLLSRVPEDKRENCKLALKKVVETLC